ncbi:hypothetical protein QM012_000573 [Aureobasidium pullulans]|uniref:Peptidase A1 domain-containing protein n=1 Tax=Aureobasidium pullulans TaxID=5580 RepID=A0ABR0TW30_AURPU
MRFLTEVLISLSLLFCYGTATDHPRTVELALMSSVDNTEGIQYFVNLTVGTPGQLQTVFIDTGSSNTVVFSSNASFNDTPGSVGGTFDSTQSSTFEMIRAGALNLYFGLATTWFNGDYVKDVIQINDLVIKRIPFGLAYRLRASFTPYTGILGLGYSGKMSYKKKHQEASPPNFVEGLVQAGAISSRLYSIYLNTLDQYGSILFGGLDTDKYEGQLTTLNFLHPHGKAKINNFLLYLEEVKVKPYNESYRTILRSTTGNRPYTLPDTGVADWQLPNSAYREVVRYAGGQPSMGLWPGVGYEDIVRPCCEVARGIANTAHFEITFSGNGSNTANLRVDLADLFSPIATKDGSAATDSSSRPMCWLRVREVPGGTTFYTSSSVMRAGYWVFDLDNGQVSLAQAKLGAISSKVVQVDAGPDGLHKAVKDHLRGKIQKDKVEGQMSVSVTYELSTATNTVGYATGAEYSPTPTGTGIYDPSGDYSPPRS